LSFTATATDPDLPAQALTFTLIGAPAGASINSSSGAFAWTPTESQGGSNYVFTLRVTDNGSPAQNDEETITVTVNKVNNAPVLAAIGNKSIDEGSALSFTASATDPDLPTQALTFTLIGAPAGASINSGSGAFTWTPTQSQGGSNYTFTVRVTDDGSPAQSDEEAITITVNEVNSAPVLAAIGNKTVNEGSTLSFTATATDSDLPAQALTFALIGAPAGASINSISGAFTWTPTESQGGSNYVFTVRVTDSGSPSRNDEETITVTVDKVNSPPVLGSIGDKTVNEGESLAFMVTATDSDLPAQSLTFSLAQGPAGASIDSTTGNFQWTPNGSGAATNQITIEVADNGTPSVKDAETFNVVVVSQPRIISISRAQSGQVTVQWQAFPGKTYRVQYNSSLGGTWSNLQPDIAATGATASAVDNPSGPQLFYRVLLLD
jgi:hypothetical protein